MIFHTHPPRLSSYWVHLLIVARWWWLNAQIRCARQRSQRHFCRVFFSLSNMPSIVEESSGEMGAIDSCYGRPRRPTAW
jgi:hypothetical protein